MGKKYEDLKQKIDRTKIYSSEEACELVKQVSLTKFDWTVEAHIKTWANPKYNDQMIRGTVVLPNGSWKTPKVAAYVDEDKKDEASEGGADIVGNEDLYNKIENKDIDFDILVTTPEKMKELAKVAKILWPQGVMPSPKAWTVSNDIKWTVEELKKGRIEFKLDRTWNIHVPIGRISFDSSQIKENLETLISAIQESRPEGVKGKLIRKIVIAPTMWPGVKVKV